MATEEGKTVVTVQGKAQMLIRPKPEKGGKPGTDGKVTCRFRSELLMEVMPIRPQPGEILFYLSPEDIVNISVLEALTLVESLGSCN